jgi:hypothetical protein
VVARVQQLAGSGRYTEAFALLSQGGSVPAATVRAEQRRLATSAQQRAAVARRTASDFNTGGTDPFVQGASRQQLGEEHLAASRLRPAVLEFVRAHDAFEQAMATRTARAAGPAPPQVGPPAAPAPPAAPSSAPAPVAQAPGAVVTDVMAPYTNEHVRQVLAQWRQYYEARNIEGLRRLWPTMDSAWERRLRGTFGIPGELQWYPSDQRVVRQPEQATVMATIRNITPMPDGAASGTSTSMLNLTIELTPRGDQLVITSIRQR